MGQKQRWVKCVRKGIGGRRTDKRKEERSKDKKKKKKRQVTIEEGMWAKHDFTP